MKINDQSNSINRRSEDKKQAWVAFLVCAKQMDQKQFLENCATQHMDNQKYILRYYKSINDGDQTVNTADRNGELKIKGYHSASLKKKFNGEWNFIEL